MTIEEMNATLRGLGLKRTYRPEWDAETGTIMLKTRKPAQIVDGALIGSDICLTQKRMREGVFRVWTPQSKKSNRIAKENKITVRLLDGEAELFVPARLADQLLPVFGAKIRRFLTGKRLEDAKRAAEKGRNSPDFGFCPPKTGVNGL